MRQNRQDIVKMINNEVLRKQSGDGAVVIRELQEKSQFGVQFWLKLGAPKCGKKVVGQQNDDDAATKKSMWSAVLVETRCAKMKPPASSGRKI